MNHQRRAAVADQLLDGLAFFLLIMIAVADQQKIACLIRDLFNRFHHGAEKGVGNITHYQPNGFGGLLGERASIGIGMIIQGFHGGLYRLARCVTGFWGVVNHARDGCYRHTCQTGHILYCRHSLPSYWG